MAIVRMLKAAPFLSRLSLLSLGAVALALSACSNFERKDMTQQLKESIVLITYGNIKGHATGFFIQGDGEACTVLTVAHAVPKDSAVRLTAYDQTLFEATNVQRAEDDDLAVITFAAADEADCPYAVLALGNSERVRIDDAVKMAGYPERAGAERLVMQVPAGRVTNVENPPLPEGYAISYDMTTVSGMSGAPVVNEKGKVIGVHGLTDAELVSLGRNQQSSLSAEQADEIEAAEERVEARARINHFKWGIPIATFKGQRDHLLGSVLKSDTAHIAKVTIRQWLKAKQAAYSAEYKYNREGLDSIVIGKMLNEVQNDVDLIQLEGVSIDYSYGETITILSIDSEHVGNMTVLVEFTESATFYQRGQLRNTSSYTDDKVTVSYELVRKGSNWLIRERQ